MPQSEVDRRHRAATRSPATRIRPARCSGATRPVSAPQAWERSGNSLFVTVSASGEVGTAPVTAVREINLQSGDDRLIHADRRIIRREAERRVRRDAAVLCRRRPADVQRDSTGRQTGLRAGAVPEAIDPVQQVLYVEVRGALIGIDPMTGLNEPGTIYPGPPGTYGVRAGVALGLDTGSGRSRLGLQPGQEACDLDNPGAALAAFLRGPVGDRRERGPG